MDSELSLLMAQACSEVSYVVPYQRNWDVNDPQPAGSLTMKQISEWPEDGQLPQQITNHFVCIKANDISIMYWLNCEPHGSPKTFLWK